MQATLDTREELSTISFRNITLESVIGNLGEPLGDGPNSDDSEEAISGDDNA